MKKEEDKKRKGASEKMPIEKSENDDFKQKMRAAYSAMGKLGGQARAKQLAEKGFRKETEPQQKNKTSTPNKGGKK